jgi:hypothetical protein
VGWELQVPIRAQALRRRPRLEYPPGGQLTQRACLQGHPIAAVGPPRRTRPDCVPGDDIMSRIRLLHAPDKDILITPTVGTPLQNEHLKNLAKRCIFVVETDRR